MTPTCGWCGDNCGPIGVCDCPAAIEIARLRAAMHEAMAALEPDDAEALPGWAILEHALRCAATPGGKTETVSDPKEPTEAELLERNLRRAENWRKADSPPGPIDERYDEPDRWLDSDG